MGPPTSSRPEAGLTNLCLRGCGCADPLDARKGGPKKWFASRPTGVAFNRARSPIAHPCYPV